MKKKLALILFLSVYLLTLTGGFIYAKSTAPLVEPTPMPIPQPQQTNWILVRIDDMTSETPRLVSVWVMLTTLSPEPFVYFKPVYSIDWNNASKSALSLSFSVNDNRTLNPAFLDELTRLNIQHTGLVLMDNEGFKNFSAWFTAPTTQGYPTTRPVTWQQVTPLSPEVQSYQQICTAMQSSRPHEIITLNWQDLSTGHFILHPNVNLFASLWNRLLNANTSANCTVMLGP